MGETNWYNRYLKLSHMEQVLNNFHDMAGDFCIIGAASDNLRMATAAKKIQLGIIELRQEIRDMSNQAFELSGAVRIPVQNLNKPQLRVVRKGE